MVGMVVSAEAAPGACWTLSALEVPGSTAWTVAAGTLAPVVRERTSYFDAPVTTYGSVLTVAVVPSLPPSITLSGCHWLQAYSPLNWWHRWRSATPAQRTSRSPRGERGRRPGAGGPARRPGGSR